MNIMIDIETFGTNDDSPIMSIGAVKFDKEITGKFLVNVTLESNLENGAILDGKTVDWWLQQDAKAIKSLVDPVPIDLKSALNGLYSFTNFKKILFGQMGRVLTLKSSIALIRDLVCSLSRIISGCA